MAEHGRIWHLDASRYDTMLQGENQNGHGTSTEPDVDSFEVPV